MDRPGPVDYWFCPVCKRVYEVQNIPGGRWLRIYQKADVPVSGSLECWTRIYVLPDIETDAATEEDWEICLSDYLQQKDSVRYYLSPDEKIVHAVDKDTGTIRSSYELEDAWSPSTEA